VAEVQIQEAHAYQSRALGDYRAPGPAEDPWGPYIAEAAKRFDVPELWIRSVMHQESGGHMFRNGQLITSWAGAMGLMQVMPQTYDELKARHNLGEDAFDPRNNILAGAAYIREMYDMYGAPGFLAAYNAGPRRLDDYLSNSKPLPLETRRYVASIGPFIAGVYPEHRSPAEQFAMNELPLDIPGGLRYGRGSGGAADQGAPDSDPAPVVNRRVASALRSFEGDLSGLSPHRGSRVIEYYEGLTPPPGAGWHLAQAPEPLPYRHAGASRQQTIQLGAYSTEPVRGGNFYRGAPRQATAWFTPVPPRPPAYECAKYGPHGCLRYR
jgi:hypothetical protein